MRQKNLRLKTFLNGSSNPAEQMPGCANLDRHYGCCLFAESCNVLSGKRCKYFEEAVLPSARDLGQAEHITKQYQKQVGGIEAGFDPKEGGGDQRRCGCGAPLAKRRRLCDECKKRKQREASREQMRKRRAGCYIVK